MWIFSWTRSPIVRCSPTRDTSAICRSTLTTNATCTPEPCKTSRLLKRYSTQRKFNSTRLWFPFEPCRRLGIMALAVSALLAACGQSEKQRDHRLWPGPLYCIMMPPTSARVREATKPSSIPSALPAVDGIWYCMCAWVLCTLVVSEHCAVVKCMWYSDVYLLLCM